MVGPPQRVPLSQKNRPLDSPHLALCLSHRSNCVFCIEGVHNVTIAKQSWDAELYEARHGFVWRLGEGVVDLLNPQAGEHILDLGCGPGQLTKKIADSGADVVGLDSSPAMIGQARQNYPKLRFVLQDAAALQFENEFDAVFSNAALHWMLDPAAVVRGISKALRPAGRFVAEMGGKGNVQTIVQTIQRVVTKYSDSPLPPPRQYYPSLSEYAAILEAHGLEVRMAQLFDRPTPLEGDAGMEVWIRQFKLYYFENLRATQQRQAMDEVIADLRGKLLNEKGWFADYRRLRMEAIK
jgi:trans-aconitate methyltransferase